LLDRHTPHKKESIYPASKMVKRSRSPEAEPESPDPSSTPLSPSAGARTIVQPEYLKAQTNSSKISRTDPDSDSGEVLPAPEMRCSLPPHRNTLTFATFEEYDVHYAKTHVNRCVECKKNFPTTHFLNLHIEENHDSLVSVRRERGEKTYACFVEDCDRKCSTPQKRRMHLVDKHAFPQDYDFFVVNDGIDRRSSMLRSGKHRRRSSAAKTEARNRQRSATMESTVIENGVVGNGMIDKSEIMKETGNVEVEEVRGASLGEQKEDDEMDGLSGAMSALKFVPTSVRFGGRGRGRGRGGFSRS